MENTDHCISAKEIPPHRTLLQPNSCIKLENYNVPGVTGAEITPFPTSLPTKRSSKKGLTSQGSSSPNVVHQFPQQETTDNKDKHSKALVKQTMRPLR